MIRFLQLLFFGHVHKWKTIKVVPFENWGESPKEVTARGTRYVQQCEACGVVVKRDLI